MSYSSQSLGEQIERLVHEHIEASRRAAAQAVERAFSAASSVPGAKTPRPASRTSGRRRPASEMSALGERLYEAVCAHPGETMAVLAPAVGETPRALHRPMTALKRAGRVRSVGQRHQMRYYPMVAAR